MVHKKEESLGVVFFGSFLIASLVLISSENLSTRAGNQTQIMECQPAEVIVQCMDYEEGWDDAERSVCAPEPIDVETLRVMCEEMAEYGYVPGC